MCCSAVEHGSARRSFLLLTAFPPHICKRTSSEFLGTRMGVLLVCGVCSWLCTAPAGSSFSAPLLVCMGPASAGCESHAGSSPLLWESETHTVSVQAAQRAPGVHAALVCLFRWAGLAPVSSHSVLTYQPAPASSTESASAAVCTPSSRDRCCFVTARPPAGSALLV